jgi:transposase
LVDALGNPVHVHLTPGNVHDIVEAPKLIALARGQNFIADKGYDSKAVVQAVEARGMTVVIPPRACTITARRTDFYVYKERHLVEVFFNRLKQYRRTATRYEKTACNFLGFVLLASIRIWLA